MDKDVELTDAIRMEKDVRVLKRLIAVNMSRLGEIPIDHTADTIGVRVRTIQTWMELYEKHGVEGLYD